MRAKMTGPVPHAVITLGVIVLVGGIAGLIYSAGQDLMEVPGASVGAFIHLNPLGSWVSIALGSLTIVSGALRSRMLALSAAVGFLACVILVTFGANRPTNPLGGTASTVGFYLGPAAGLLALVLAERAADRAEEDDRDTSIEAGGHADRGDTP